MGISGGRKLSELRQHKRMHYNMRAGKGENSWNERDVEKDKPCVYTYVVISECVCLLMLRKVVVYILTVSTSAFGSPVRDGRRNERESLHGGNFRPA